MSRQITGNVGLYYICYELSKRDWNVLPTSRNTEGIDIIIYSQKSRRMVSIQVKALSKKNPIGLGNNLDKLIASIYIICQEVYQIPKIYILTKGEVKEWIDKREKNGKISYWLQPKNYEQFKDNWEKIGAGLD